MGTTGQWGLLIRDWWDWGRPRKKNQRDKGIWQIFLIEKEGKQKQTVAGPMKGPMLLCVHERRQSILNETRAVCVVCVHRGPLVCLVRGDVFYLSEMIGWWIDSFTSYFDCIFPTTAPDLKKKWKDWLRGRNDNKNRQEIKKKKGKKISFSFLLRTGDSLDWTWNIKGAIAIGSSERRRKKNLT